MIEIREFQPSETSQLKQLVIASAVYQKSQLEEEQLNIEQIRSTTAENFDRNIQVNDFKYFVAIDTEIVGYVLVEKSSVYIDRGSIVDLYIMDMYQGQGLGKQLMETAIDWLREQAVKVISLAVHKKNHRAIQLYESFGFTDEPEVYRYLEKKL